MRRRLNLRIHLGQRIVAFLDAEQRENVRQGVFQGTVEPQHLADHLLAPLARVVLRGDPEVVAQQLDHRQVGRGLAVRDRVGFQHQAAALRDRLELEEQA